MKYDGMSPAEVYESGLVPGVFSQWTPALVTTVKPASGERALDLACGTGAVTRELAAALGPEGSIVAVDVSPAMLEVAQQIPMPTASATVEWVEASAVDIPLPADDVDLAVCQQGLQFFPDKPAAAAEIARVLRPGGRLALSVWRGLEHNPVQEALNESLTRRLGTAIFDLPFSFGDPAQVERLFIDAGLVDVDVHDETRNARFDSVADFARVMAVGAKPIVPAFAALTDEEAADIEQAFITDLTPLADRFGGGGAFLFPMTSLVVAATKP